MNPNLAVQRIWYAARRKVADIQYQRGKNNYPHQIFFIAGMSLGGTTWVKNLFAHVPGIFWRPTPMPFDVAYMQNICDSAFERIPKRGNTLIKTHLNPWEENIACLKRNGVEKVIIVYRDFRDVMLSYYYRMMDAPKPKQAFDYIDYRAMSKEAAISYLIVNDGPFRIKWIYGWFEQAKKNPKLYHFVKFEDLKRDVFGEFQKMLDFYGIKLTQEIASDIIEKARGKGNVKDNLKAAAILPFGISSNFRSGKVGGWREEFTQINIDLCKKVFGEALIKMEYENSLDW